MQTPALDALPALAALPDALVLTLAQAATNPPPAAEAGKSLWQYIQGGGVIGYVIIGLSVVAVALSIVQVLRLRVAKLAPPDVVSSIEKLFVGEDVKGVIRYCESQPDDVFIAKVFGSALTRCSRSPFGFLELRSALEESGAVEVARLGRPTDGIALIASLAPMLGLLGTVVGMVGAFDTIGSTRGTAQPSDLAVYISIALITTVQGLVVAIPCTAAATYFRGRLERAATEVAGIAEGLASDFELAAGVRAQAQRPAPAPAPARAGAPARVGGPGA